LNIHGLIIPWVVDKLQTYPTFCYSLPSLTAIGNSLKVSYLRWWVSCARFGAWTSKHGYWSALWPFTLPCSYGFSPPLGWAHECLAVNVLSLGTKRAKRVIQSMVIKSHLRERH